MKAIYRLKSKRQFAFVYKKGAVVSNSALVLVYCFNNNQNCKIGFSVSSKYGNAVKRNKIKRQLRQYLGTIVGNIAQNASIVFSVREKASELSYLQLTYTVNQLLIRAKLISKDALL